MTNKGSFQNQFVDYSDNSEIVRSLLNDTRDGLSEVFLQKLEKFKSSKLQLLLNEMQEHIYYDYTVYTGSCGLALYFFLCYTKTLDENYLLEALKYIELKNLRGRKISFLCGDAGPLALAIVITTKLTNSRSDMPDYKALVQRLMNLIQLMDESPDEILYGKAGYLYALLFVVKHTPRKDLIPHSHISKVITSILKTGKQYSAFMKSDSPLLWQWHDKIYFGAAHGMSGILCILLQARSYIDSSEMRNFVKPTVEWLLNHRYASGNFPSSLGSASGDRLVQWCHGAPGFVPLCLLAYEVFEEESYLKVALKSGDVVWERGLCGKGYSLCHGVSGNAYAFLQLYQATKRPIHLYRACCFMEWCAVERVGTELHRPDRPASLFEGLVGRLYFLEDLKDPAGARFPALSV